MKVSHNDIPDRFKDGIDHINIFSKGKTEVGRLCSNFAKTPFVHPVYGKFKSMEGYWYWIKTGKQYDHLRTLYGSFAKLSGRHLERVHNPDFASDIEEGLQCKVEQTPELQRLLIESTLPFTHYYVISGRVSFPNTGAVDLVDWYEKMREALKEPPVKMNY